MNVLRRLAPASRSRCCPCCWQLPFLDRLDRFIYDVRLRATPAGHARPAIVIVDIDDPSLQRLGQWPWGRDQLARLTISIMERQQARVLGFDVPFVEPDASSGLEALSQLTGPLQDRVAFAQEIEWLAPLLDRDAAFAKTLAGWWVALGF